MAKQINTKTGAKYLYKGNEYTLLRFPARDKTSDKKVVVYCDQDDNWYTREANEFFQKFNLIG